MHSSRFFMSALAVLLLHASRASSQSITGRVLESVSRAPARGLSVQVVADSGSVVVETRTDSTGVFLAMLPANGTFRVRFALDSQTDMISDTIGVHDDAFVEREFIVKVPRAFFDFEVQKQVAMKPGSGAPRYPDVLKRQDIEGEVLAQFVVDTTGMAIPESFKVLRSTHELFTREVRDVLPRMRFYPAEINGRPVRQMVQQPFTFRLGGPAIRILPSEPLFPAYPPPVPQRPRP